MADEDDIDSYWEGLRPHREPDPPMTEERRQAIMAGRRLGKSVNFSPLDMVQAQPMSRPVGPLVRFQGQIHQGLNPDEVDSMLERGGDLVSHESIGPVVQARAQYSEEEFDALLRDYVDPGRGQPIPTSEEQAEDLDENALRIRRIREIESRRARGLNPIPLWVEGYTIQPHETLEEFANRAHLAYEIDPDEDADERRTRAWEDTHVLNSPEPPPMAFGNMNAEQAQFVQWLFDEWGGMTEEQQNWFQDQVTLARGNQPIDRSALGIGTEIHRRIEATVREALQGYVGQPGNRTQMRNALDRVVMDSIELFNNRGLVAETFARMADQMDLGESMQRAFPEVEPIAPLDFGDVIRGPVRNPRRD